jgi:hypothetical protein
MFVVGRLACKRAPAVEEAMAADVQPARGKRVTSSSPPLLLNKMDVMLMAPKACCNEERATKLAA